VTKTSSSNASAGSPDLRSADAINDWLAKANERLADVFSDRPEVVEEVQTQAAAVVEEPVASNSNCDEGSVPNSLSGTGTTVYAPTVLLPASTGPGSPVMQSEAATGSAGLGTPVVQTKPVMEPLELSQTEEAAAEAHHAEDHASSETPDSSNSLDSASERSAAPPPAVAKAGIAGNVSESEHFSEDEFDDDAGDASFDESELSAQVDDDRGESDNASVSIDGPSLAHGAPAAAAPPKSLGATNASISYDEDFEAADVEEEDTLGASFGGA
jgi:hypothetical protein